MREAADHQADQREAEPEAQMQVGADIGEAPQNSSAASTNTQMMHDARPGRAEHGGIVGDQAARCVSGARLRRASPD